LHLWWARRPLAACRAIIFAQLVDDPSSRPDRFPTERDQQKERERLHALIAELVKWKHANNEYLLQKARFEIARSIAWKRGEGPPPAEHVDAVLRYLEQHAPPVFDPLCGGGSIPREAQRRGEKLGLSEDELAFYDALADNESAVAVLGDKNHKKIARELVERVRRSVSVDWSRRENARAQLRVPVKRILRKYGYPPEEQERATELVLEQTEALAAAWAKAA